MKVLLLSSLYPPNIGGGAEIILHAHALALKGQGIDVAVLTIGNNSGLVEDEVDGIRVWRAGYRNCYFHHEKNRRPAWQRIIWHLRDIYNPLMNSYIYKVMDVEQPDVVSCHNLTGWSIAAWDAISHYKVPIVQVLHDQYFLCPNNSMFRDNKRCLQRCWRCRVMRRFHPRKSNQVRAVIGVSHFVLDKLLAHGYFQKTAIKKVIHNARTLPVVPSKPLRADFSDNVIFGFIGTLASTKGIELLIDIFMANVPPNWRLKIAGTGKKGYEANLRARCAGVSCVDFIGYCSPQEFFQQVDVTVVPSLWEDTFPGAVFESFLYGVPVIGSRRGGIPEMICDGLNGMSFEPDHPDELLNCMQTVAGNISEWRNRREIIQDNAEEYADERSWTKKWIHLYKDVITPGDTPGFVGD